MAAPLLPAAPTLTGLSARWTAFAAMARKEFTVMTRYPVEFIASFGQVFAIVSVFTLAGLTFAGRGPASWTGPTAGLVVYGFILFMFLNDTLWSIGYNIRREQTEGTLEQLYLSPSSKFGSLISRVVNTLFWTGLLSIAGSGLMAWMIGSLPVANPWLGLYILAMSLSGTFGVGFAFAALTLRLKETAQTLANVIQFAFLVLCANFFPFSALPPFLEGISRLLPLAYCVDAFRSALMGFPPGFPELASPAVELVIVTVFGLAMPIVGYWLYRWAEFVARRQGSLSEY